MSASKKTKTKDMQRFTGGRPLTLVDKRDAIISNLNMGITLKTACEYAGIDYQTFTLWRRRGEAALQKQQSGFLLDEKEVLYADFVLDVTEAKSKLLVMLETQLVNKVKNNEISAKNIIHMLERLDRAQWGRVDTIKVSNTDSALDEQAQNLIHSFGVCIQNILNDLELSDEQWAAAPDVVKRNVLAVSRTV